MAEEKQKNDERTWAAMCHVAAFAGFILPFGNLIGPLVLWLINKDKYDFADEQGKESLNFQISIVLYVIISVVLIIVIVGIPLIIAALLFSWIMPIVAAVNAGNGVHYKYPLAIRFVK